MKLTAIKIFKHLALVCRHRHAVFINCCKCGIPLQGLIHDLSKLSPAEFFESARYYQGNRSPIAVCRHTEGYSRAWLHHKGRNRHHMEYWFDEDCAVHPMMPYKYAVECICDKLAATRTYAGGRYTPDMPLIHWEKYGSRATCNPKTRAFVERVFKDLSEQGDKFVLNPRYMKKTFSEICRSDEPIPKPIEELPLAQLPKKDNPQ